MAPSERLARLTGGTGRGIAALALLVASAGGAPALSAPAPVPDTEAWRKVEAGRVTVVGTASDTRLVETAVTLRALVALLPGLVPGAFGAPPPLVVAVVHDPAHLARVSFPHAEATARGRIVLAAAGDEEARPVLLRSVASALGRRAATALPGWLVEGLAEYLSTFSAGETRATLGRLVPDHVARLREVRPGAGRPALFVEGAFEGEGARNTLLRAQAWAVVHLLLQGTPGGEEHLGRFARLLAGGAGAEAAFRDAFGEGERELFARAVRYVVDSRPLARIVPVPAGAPLPGRLLPLTRAGAARVLGGVARVRDAPEPGTPAPPVPLGRATPQVAPFLTAAPPPAVAVSRDVPAEVDLVNRLVDEGREGEALARLEALHASLGGDPEMQRALAWDVREVRRVVLHNRLVKRYNEAIGLLNAGRRQEALPVFRQVAASAEDPDLRRLAWERATAPAAGRR